MTNGFKKMCGLSNNDNRFCNSAVENTSNLISGFQTLVANGYYTKRHNAVIKYLHHTVCTDYNSATKNIFEDEPDL